MQKEFNLYGNNGSKSLEDAMLGGVNVSTLEFESNVIDSPVISSRGGLYIYVNALVCTLVSFIPGIVHANIRSKLVGRPLIDDSMLINYLNNRYGVSISTFKVELLLG